MPETAEKILMMLYGTERDFELLSEFGIYRSGTKVTDKPEVLFARQNLDDIMAQVEKIREAQRREYEKEGGK
jgi:methionyl-tRNA synthetase